MKNSSLQTEEPLFIEKAVKERYAKGAARREEALCCPVSYDPKFLRVIPEEILEKDYGCGDPSQFVKEGDTVLDLGSGSGKICFIASQIVGPKGKVIGVDFNLEMLSLAKKYQKEIGNKIGWHNVEFRWGKIQDLKTNLEVLENSLEKDSIEDVTDYLELQEKIAVLSRKKPLVADDSVDVVISNCVLNLVRPEDKKMLFQEIHRVLKRGGRIAVSDIVSDEVVPQNLQSDPELWSGCISGAFEEKAFLKAFEEAGFYGLQIEKRDEKPWKTVHGIEFRSITVTGYKGKEGACWERNQAVIYKGPWKQVEDDDKHVLKRGVRTAVCDKTFQIFSKSPYKKDLLLVPPLKEIPLSRVKPFDCSRDVERSPKETKGLKYKASSAAKSTCMEGGCC